MKISVNGQGRDIPAPLTVATLLQDLGLQGKRVAVEVNREIVPRTLQGERVLQDGDRVEVVQAIGGG